MSYYRMYRHNFLVSEMNPSIGDVTAVEHGWVKTFVILPRRTVGGRWVWLQKVYCRRVWVYTGFVDEPETQYANLFDILKHPGIE